MKTRTVVTLCIALLTLGIMAPAAFSRGEHAHDKDKEFRHESKMKMKSKKEMFSKEQLQQFESLKVDNAKQLIPLKAEMQVKRLELKQLWGADELDEAAIMSKTDEMLTVGTQIRQAMARHKLDIAKLLTKEQRQAWMKKHAFDDDDKKKGRKYRGRRHHRAWDKDRKMRDHDHDEEWEEKREMRHYRREKREKAREMRRHGRHERREHKHADKDWDGEEEMEGDEDDSDE